MHREEDYSKIADETAKRAKAIEDLKQWFGLKRFEDFGKSVKATNPSMSRLTFIFAVSMGGAEGYPVEVWADELGVPPYTEEEIEARFR